MGSLGFTWVHFSSLQLILADMGHIGGFGTYKHTSIHTYIWTFLLYIEIPSDLIIICGHDHSSPDPPPLFLANPGKARGCSINSLVIDSLIKSVRQPFPATALRRRHAQTVRDSSSSFKIDYVIVV